MRFLLVVSLLAGTACGIKGNPRPPKVTYLPDDAPDAGCCAAAREDDAKPAPDAGLPTSTEAPKQ